MEIGTLNVLLRQVDGGSALRAAFVREWNSKFDPIDFLNYDPATHKIVRDRIYRQDKIFYREIPNEYDSNGAPLKEMRISQVSRVALPYQKEIVDTTVSFTVGGKIKIKATPKKEVQAEVDLFDELNYTWNNTKMNFKIKEIARRLFSETEVAVIMFATKDSDGEPELKLRIVSPSDGDVLYPIYNGIGDMIAFGFEYLTISDNGVRVNFDVYTNDFIYKYNDVNGNFAPVKAVSNIYGKIPVIYFNQSESEWKRIQSCIDRLELTISNLCDTNDYNGSPILFAEGEIDGFSDKGETGKLITGRDGAKLTYLTWDKAPESVKLEIETLVEEIHTKTRTVNLSPQAIKGMGSAPSGVAFDRMLILPHMKAQDKQDGALGEGIQRLLNLFKSAITSFIKPELKSAKKLYVEPEFSLFRIDDLSERIDTMSKAMPGKQLVSRESAVKYIGITNDTSAEVEAIVKEDTDPVPPAAVPGIGGAGGSAAA